jgi:hypothetical protein
MMDEEALHVVDLEVSKLPFESLRAAGSRKPQSAAGDLGRSAR